MFTGSLKTLQLTERGNTAVSRKPVTRVNHGEHYNSVKLQLIEDYTG